MRYWLFAILVLVTQKGLAQNLVPNPSFEIYSQCPDDLDQLENAIGWLNPTTSSPDYFNSCSSFSQYQTPQNAFGKQVTHSGNSYSGICIYYDALFPNFREYVQIQLDSKLQKNKLYSVSFYVSLAGRTVNAITDEVSLFISDYRPTNNFADILNNIIPQINSNVLIEDTTNWICVSGQYKASGGEEYITIGNFKTDNQTTKEPTQYPNGDYIYIYI